MTANEATIQSVPDSAAPVSRFQRLLANSWFWVGAIVLLMGLVLAHWVMQTRADRAELHETIGKMLHADRAELAGPWHVPVYKPYHFKSEWADRVQWEPNAQAPVAMAITPRSPINESDAIFMLYHGQQPQILFVLSSSGVYVNNMEVNQRKYPKLLMERQLTPREIAGLEELKALIIARRDRFNPQSEQYLWTNQVLKTLLDVKQAQAPDSVGAK